MRTSGGRGADAWMLVVPVIALLVGGRWSEGSLDAVLLRLEGVIRHTLNAGLAVVTRIF